MGVVETGDYKVKGIHLLIKEAISQHIGDDYSNSN